MSDWKNVPQRALIVEDDLRALDVLLRSFQSVGFDLGGKKSRDLAKEAQRGLAVAGFGHHTLHFTATASGLHKLIRENAYSVCFLDHELIGGTSTEAASYIIQKCPDTKLVLIGVVGELQLESLREKIGANYVQELWAAGRILSCRKLLPGIGPILNEYFHFERDKRKLLVPDLNCSPR